MWAVSDIKLVTSVECGVGYCMRFALIFVKIWEIVSCVEIPDDTSASPQASPEIRCIRPLDQFIADHIWLSVHHELTIHNKECTV